MVVQKVNIDGVSFNVVYDHYCAYWESLEQKKWEPETLGAMVTTLGPEWVFFDVGTWIGPTALYAAALGAETFCFEPDPVALQRFVANLSVNPELRSRVKVLNAACAAEDGEITIYADALGNSETSVFKDRDRVIGEVNAKIKLNVRTVNLNSFVRSLYLNSRKVFFKVDIEGAEFDLLPSIVPEIKTMQNAVMHISTHPFNVKVDDPKEQLDCRRQLKTNLLDLLGEEMHWYSWEDGKISSVTFEHVKHQALLEPDAPDVLMCSVSPINI